MTSKTLWLDLCSLALVAVLAFGSLADAQERILIPVAFTGRGAFDSTWSTEITAINRSPNAWRIPGVTFGVLCSIPPGCFLDELPAGGVGTLFNADGHYLDAPHGLLIPVLADGQQALSARVGAWPRSYTGRGTELPLPAEREFRTGPLLFPSVPFGSQKNVRVALRLYGLDLEKPSVLQLSVLQRWQGSAWPVAQQTIVLSPVPSDDGFTPSYLHVPLDQIYHPSRFMDVEVAPQMPGEEARLWGFVTVTDNVSNEVTIISAM